MTGGLETTGALNALAGTWGLGEAGAANALAARMATFPLATSTPTLEELDRGHFVSASIAATTTVRLGPVNVTQRIGALTLAFSNAVATSDTNYWTVALKRYRGASVVTLATKTTKVTGGEAITADQGWTFDSQDWSASLRHIRKGDVLALTFTKASSATTLTDVTAAIRYEPGVTPLVYDTFDRADSTSSLGSADSGQTWSSIRGTWGISSGRAYTSVAEPLRAYATIDVGLADVTVTQVMVDGGASEPGGPVARMSDGNNGFTANFGALYRLEAASLNQLAAYSTVSAGDTISLKVSGSTVTVYVNGVSVASVTDTFNQTVTNHGIRMSNSTAGRTDDFMIAV